MIRSYKPVTKRKILLKKTNDLSLLINAINYSSFTFPNLNNITGIKFMENLIYHDNHLENIDLSADEINGIYANYRMKVGNIGFCDERDKAIIESLGNIEMNKYCLETADKISVFKITELNKMLYKYVPYPEYTGRYRTEDNMILGGNIQPVTVSSLFEKIEELNELIEHLVDNICNFSIAEYIDQVATIHYKLTVLHPFNDGNGRLSRAFLNWLLRLKFLPPIYIDSSNKKAYLDALKDIDNGADNTKLQILIIKAIISTMAELHKSWN